MNILESLNQVLAESGFLEKKSFFGQNTDIDDRQMAAIANRTQIEIRDFFPWTTLRRDGVITQQEGVTRYALPEDFRSFVIESMWQGNGDRAAEFPVPDGRWFQYKFSGIGDAGTRRIRKYGNEVEIIQPQGGEVIEYEYISKYAVEDKDGLLKERFTENTDSFRLCQQTLILGVQAHWAKTKLLPQANDWYANYQAKMREAIGRSTGTRIAGGPAPGYSGRYNPYSPYTPLWKN